eukprot:maker-scaffold_7-snap-gene-4.8-mRNA-1 protein AED:0.01 eAED:0.01 QI:97/1/1/1/0.75/0.6/5/1395/435
MLAATSTLRDKPDVEIQVLLTSLQKNFNLVDIDLESLKKLNSYEDLNYYFEAKGEKYVAKIYNVTESNNLEVLQAQAYAMLYLTQKIQEKDILSFTVSEEIFCISCNKLVHENLRKYLEGSKEAEKEPKKQKLSLFPLIKTTSGQEAILRVLKYIPGKHTYDHIQNTHTIYKPETENEEPQTKFLYGELGKAAADLDILLKDFYHPALYRKLLWEQSGAAEYIDEHLKFLDKTADARIIETINKVKEDFSKMMKKIDSKKINLRKRIIHNDLNDQNLIVSECKFAPYDDSVTFGILDFGDICHTFLISELAIAATYCFINMTKRHLSLELKKELTAVGKKEEKMDEEAATLELVEFIKELLKNYDRKIPLLDDEKAAFKTFVCARLALIISVAAKGLCNPNVGADETEYLNLHSLPGRTTLKRIYKVDPADFWKF